MTITINKEPIDFTLEKEKTADDILLGIREWLESQGLLIGGVHLNGLPVPMTGEGWGNQSVENLEHLAVEAISPREARARQLQTAWEYFELLARVLLGESDESLVDLAAGYRELRSILPPLLDEGPYPAVLPHWDEVAEKLGFPGNGSYDADTIEVLAKEARSLSTIFSLRHKEISNPGKESRNAVLALASMEESLADVAVQLQTGRDNEAMGTIISLVELFQSLLRSLSWTGSLDTYEDIITELSGLLEELEEGLKHSDTVLIGDLLEYEIGPKIKELPTRLGIEGS